MPYLEVAWNKLDIVLWGALRLIGLKKEKEVVFIKLNTGTIVLNKDGTWFVILGETE